MEKLPPINLLIEAAKAEAEKQAREQLQNNYEKFGAHIILVQKLENGAAKFVFENSPDQLWGEVSKIETFLYGQDDDEGQRAVVTFYADNFRVAPILIDCGGENFANYIGRLGWNEDQRWAIFDAYQIFRSCPEQISKLGDIFSEWLGQSCQKVEFTLFHQKTQNNSILWSWRLNATGLPIEANLQP